jgi:hypothetical protein
MKSYPNSKRVRTLIHQAMKIHGYTRDNGQPDYARLSRDIKGAVSYDTIKNICTEDNPRRPTWIQEGTIDRIANALALNPDELREASTKERDFYQRKGASTPVPDAQITITVDEEQDVPKDEAPVGSTLIIELGREARLLAKFAPKEFQRIVDQVQALATAEFEKAVEELL